MYQLNPEKGTTFRRSRGSSVPTTAENLLRLLESEGPIERDWYVVKNFKRAEVGDLVVVKVGAGTKTGIVAVGCLDAVDRDRKTIDIRFSMARTRRLMRRPVPLDVVRTKIPPDRSNLVNIAPYRRTIYQWVGGRIRNAASAKAQPSEGSLSVSPFDERKMPKKPKPGYGHSSPIERARMLEKANRGHHRLLVALSQILSTNGWASIDQAKTAFDLRARHGRRWVLFEAKTLTNENEIHQVRSGLSQLLEYRYFHPQLKQHRLCLVFSRPLSPKARKFVSLLESLGVAAIWNHGGRFEGAGRVANLLLGPVVS